MIIFGFVLMVFVGADRVQWMQAKVACAQCTREECNCWVTCNKRAQACKVCTRTHVSCSRVVGWGQDEEWPTGPTITIKRKAIEEPGDEGVIKGVRGKRKPWRKGPC